MTPATPTLGYEYQFEYESRQAVQDLARAPRSREAGASSGRDGHRQVVSALPPVLSGDLCKPHRFGQKIAWWLHPAVRWRWFDSAKRCPTGHPRNRCSGLRYSPMRFTSGGAPATDPRRRLSIPVTGPMTVPLAGAAGGRPVGGAVFVVARHRRDGRGSDVVRSRCGLRGGSIPGGWRGTGRLRCGFRVARAGGAVAWAAAAVRLRGGPIPAGRSRGLRCGFRRGSPVTPRSAPASRPPDSGPRRAPTVVLRGGAGSRRRT